MKVLWHSVAPWVGSGYGGQTAQAVPRIAAQGHDVAISAYYGLAGAKMAWHGIQVLPAYASHYGKDTIVPHAINHFGGGKGAPFGDVSTRGLIITLGDVWTFDVPLLRQMCVAAWVPVDHETVPPMVADWFEYSGAIPIAMSRFGEKALQNIGMQPLYAPHAFDGKVFYPGDKAEARAKVGLPADAFVVAMVAANVGADGSRKAFYEQILAFSELRRRHSDAVLALHTDVTSPYGVDILHLLSDFPKDSYVISDQYAYRVGTDAGTVADIYRAADILSNTSWGEGFGVPIIEAQACGTPVVVTDTTAMPELAGPGWLVEGEPLWHDSQKAWARRPLIGAIVEAYKSAYDKARNEEIRAAAWAFAQDYEADTVAETYWQPALDRLAAALDARRQEATAPVDPAKLTPRVVEADGLLWLDRGPATGDAIGFADHEHELKPILDELLPAGGVLLDVGAHVGHWALRLAGKAEHVFAVEANPDTASVLRKHIALNDITNVTVIEVAAWDSHAELYLLDPARQLAGGSTRTITEGDTPIGRSTPPVKAVPLDDVTVFALAERIDLVMLDVEGADLHALRGMAQLLAAYRPVLFVECHDVYGYYQRADLEALLSDLGYTWQVAHTYETHWQPGGISDTPRYADYLVCRPTEASSD